MRLADEGILQLVKITIRRYSEALLARVAKAAARKALVVHGSKKRGERGGFQVAWRRVVHSPQYVVRPQESYTTRTSPMEDITLLLRRKN